ncbi:hypothetical protein NGB36_15260 [Streptomyces sp. RB6PN25]|uniref:GerMN domain-containing protein n=1 Tax=Streptomyces humicola TaxID=2953240 RepID=A0ABT1PW74_9ACTN|nr:hypothetical protein [Streptomyces humicola]MCQ4081931.1 hypothetical protein [Streptomyces humicola]
MAGRGDPPEGTPQGVPGGGDDEYGSVVFDESFVRAARIQEYSARERMGDAARAVRTRHPWSRGGAQRQVFVLLLLIVLAFGTAVYMGVRHPYRPPLPPQAQPLRITLIPLAPQGPVPEASADPLFTADGGARYRVGADGYTLPPAHATADFSEGEVLQALTIAKDYLVASSLDPAALTGGDVRGVRELLNPGQLDQFDRSLARPADDGQYAATGWLVRFDPARYALAAQQVLVQGTMSVSEPSADGILVTTDHTLVYTVRSVVDGAVAGAALGADRPVATPASHFTVRRQLQLYFTRDDLQGHEAEVLQAAVEAGPLACTADSAAYFRPLLAGQAAGAQAAGIDPYDHGRPVASGCGLLNPGPVPSRTPSPSPARPSRPSR